jgi:hypothetical protein
MFIHHAKQSGRRLLRAMGRPSLPGYASTYSPATGYVPTITFTLTDLKGAEYTVALQREEIEAAYVAMNGVYKNEFKRGD